MTRKSSRRDFLKGKSAAGELERAVDALQDSAAKAVNSTESESQPIGDENAEPFGHR